VNCFGAAVLVARVFVRVSKDEESRRTDSTRMRAAKIAGTIIARIVCVSEK
jgi:hypothetical protein